MRYRGIARRFTAEQTVPTKFYSSVRIRATNSPGVTIIKRSLACSWAGMSSRSASFVTRNLALPDRAVAIIRLSSGSRLILGTEPSLTDVTVFLRANRSASFLIKGSGIPRRDRTSRYSHLVANYQLKFSLVTPEAERPLVCRARTAAEVETNDDVCIENDWDATLTRWHWVCFGSRSHGRVGQFQPRLLRDDHCGARPS